MPVLIGPGSISANIIIGNRHDPWTACATVVGTTAVSIAIVLVPKSVHDFVRPRREVLVERYVEVVGRIQALYVGTVSVEMIMQGLRTWMQEF
jgi:small neutral amino acid transporter SnatA (MarC family)